MFFSCSTSRVSKTISPALSAKYGGTALGLRFQTLVAECYMATKDWQGAINSFQLAINNYKEKVEVDSLMLSIASIYYSKLNNKEKAKETLEKLIKDYPKSKLIKTADSLLKELEKKAKYSWNDFPK
jgi:tetratricopeptide (TPR) repeat protein